MPHNPYKDVSLPQSEIEKMRQIVRASDEQILSDNKEFDLNNPPKKPYVHQEYPKAVYHHEKRLVRTVNNERELAKAQGNGYKTEAFLPLDHKVPESFYEKDEDEDEGDAGDAAATPGPAAALKPAATAKPVLPGNVGPKANTPKA